MNATLFATTRLRRYLPKLRLKWSGSKPAGQCSSSEGNLSRHGRPPSRPPGLLFWAELASLLLIVLYGLVCGEAIGDAQMGVSEFVATAECARAPLDLETDRDQTTVGWSS